MIFRAFAVLVATLALGCSNPCERVDPTAQQLEVRRNGCSGTATSRETTAFCRNAFGTGVCDGADAAKLGIQLDCIEDLPTCTTATESEWQALLADCQRLPKVSEKCQVELVGH